VQLVGKQTDSSAEKRSQPVRLPGLEELQALQAHEHCPAVVYFSHRQSFQERPLEWQRPQLVGANHAAVAEAKGAVPETIGNGRLFARLYQSNRPTAAQFDGEQCVRVVRESKRFLRAWELDEQGAAFDRDYATDPQLKIESMRQVIAWLPGR
jgi:hypothetical protein